MELTEEDRLTAEALAAQDEEIQSGFATPNLALARLASALSGDDGLRLVRRLRAGDVKERQLSARLLKESGLPADTVLSEARAALRDEDDPLVVRWLTAGLGSTRSLAALADLQRLASHASAEVRFQVTDALSMCAGGDFDRVAAPLVLLARDEDDDVRWSATYELAAWLPEVTGAAGEHLRAHLVEAAAADRSPTVRAVAAEALQG